jgi:glycosyltransferase involved in cell wall biosynthesis
MRIALISSDYAPLHSSAAVQVRDLAQAFLAQGHEPVVIVPASLHGAWWTTESQDGVQVLRVAAHRPRDTGYVLRALGEMLLPFSMLRGVRKSPFRNTRWDAVAWYSPTIFFGPLVWSLKRNSECRSYLILRDIFPEWALDLGLLRKGPAYFFFKTVAQFQYAIADTIGVQSPSNLVYLTTWAKRPTRRLEVLWNWLAQAQDVGTSICIDETILAGRRIFVYAGNMGVAQKVDIFVDLAESLRHREDIGFLFVGRGTDVPRLSAEVDKRSLKNTLFCDEIDSREIPGLLSQCHVGLLALDPRHKTHNIPGKFLAYLQAGLPVLARISAHTDLAHLIQDEGVGRVFVGESVEELRRLAEELTDNRTEWQMMSSRGRSMGARMFSTEAAAKQIVAALSENAMHSTSRRGV